MGILRMIASCRHRSRSVLAGRHSQWADWWAQSVQLHSVFLAYLRQFKSKTLIQGHFCKLEIKSFHLAPRLMGFNIDEDISSLKKRTRFALVACMYLSLALKASLTIYKGIDSFEIYYVLFRSFFINLRIKHSSIILYDYLQICAFFIHCCS